MAFLRTSMSVLKRYINKEFPWKELENEPVREDLQNIHDEAIEDVIMLGAQIL